MSSSNPAPYNNMDWVMKNNMVFVISNFTAGGDFDWLWDQKCPSKWCGGQTEVIKNIKIRTGDGRSGVRH